MAVDTVPSDNYPFATKDGKVIPLDIIRPKSLITKSFVVGANSTITIAGTEAVAVVFATEDCILYLGTAPTGIVDGAEVASALFVPKRTAVVTTLSAGQVDAVGIFSDGVVVIQLIEKWAGLALDIAYTRR